MTSSFDIIKSWIIANRGGYCDPDHQIERYAWLRDNSKGSVLSIGCGEAKIEEYIKVKDDGMINYGQEQVHGVDFNCQHLESARKRWPAGRFYQKDIIDRNFRLGMFADRYFDTVIATEILEHVPPFFAQNMIFEAVRVSKDCVLLSTPNAENITTAGDASCVYCAEHYGLWTDTLLKEFLLPSSESVRQWWLSCFPSDVAFKYDVVITKTKEFIFAKLRRA